MSEGLLTQWRDRVVEAETEISVVEEDINAIGKQRKDLKQDISRYDKLVQREKQGMLKRLEEVETQAKELEERCQLTLQQKTSAEEVYIKTLDDYESMHHIVNSIQGEEQRLREREDVETILQRESLAWAEEEHATRTRINGMQTALKAKRKQRQQEILALETELAALEKQLQQLRQEHQMPRKQQPQKEEQEKQQFAENTLRGVPALDAEQKEQQFIAANTSTSVPTHALRSCLKGSNTRSALSNLSGTNSGGAQVDSRVYGASHYPSAPVSRAASQMLTGMDTVPAVELTGTPQRAYSYAAVGKKMGSRKRDFLGDTTNQ